MSDLKDLVLVTGATKGLGLAISKRLLEDGFRVVGISRSNTKEFEALQSSFAGDVSFVAYDFSNVENIPALVKSITQEHGALYGLVNNAALGFDGVLATMHDSQISTLMDVNIKAPILLTKYACRSMLVKQRGRVINISSIIASTGFNGLSVYGASKSALNGFTKSLARELGRAKITVNSVAPGYMQTNMTAGLEGEKLESIKRRSPLGELASPKDAAAAVAYLLSSDAEMVTGTILTVDAGSTA